MSKPRYEMLSPAELEAAELQSEGLTGREIAERLGKSEGTIKVQLKCARDKMGVRNRMELANALRGSAKKFLARSVASTNPPSPGAGLADLSTVGATGSQQQTGIVR